MCTLTAIDTSTDLVQLSAQSCVSFTSSPVYIRLSTTTAVAAVVLWLPNHCNTNPKTLVNVVLERPVSTSIMPVLMS